MLELSDLFIMALVVAAGWYWWKAGDLKNLTQQQVKQHCDKASLELLDESLVLTSLGLAKNRQGHWQFRRSYRFEFSSTGEYRYRGTVTVVGKQVTNIELATHHI
jgi:hypothetical protein